MTGPYPSSCHGGPPRHNRMVRAALAAIFRCRRSGIVAIVKAGEVDSPWYQDRVAEADRAGKRARGPARAIAFGVFLLFVLVMFPIAGPASGAWSA